MFDKGDRLMALVLLTAVLNGCTQGYDQSMMNNLNLIDKYTEYFNLDDNLMGLNVAIINAGSVAGGLFGGTLADRWGRKMAIIVSALVTVVAVAIQASATHEAAFCVGRFLLGVAITVNGCGAPVWVMEMAHPRLKGFLGGLYMAIWYLAALIVGCVSLATYTIESTWAWRGLSVGQLVPSLLSLCLIPFTPESPRWLISQDRFDEAYDLLVVLHGKGDRDSALVKAEFKEIKDTLAYERTVQGGYRTLFAPAANLKRFGMVIILNIAAQVIGSNIVSSYLGLALDGAGVTEVRSQMVINIGLMVWNLGCALLGCFAIQWFGRKFMLFWASVAMTVFLVLFAVLGALYGDGENKSAQIGTVAIMFLFLGSYSIAWTPLTFVYPIEILNYAQRAKGLAVGQMACYAFGFVNTYTTPIAMDNIGGWRYYSINAAWNVVICVIIYFFFIETKGLALEEVDELFDGVVHTDGVFVGDGRNVTDKAIEAANESRAT